MSSYFDDIIKIIKSIDQELLTSDEHMQWTKYEFVSDLKNDLNVIVQKLNHYDVSALDEVETLFSPTGVLQEVSINGNWGLEFVEIGNEIDQLVLKIKETAH